MQIKQLLNTDHFVIVEPDDCGIITLIEGNQQKVKITNSNNSFAVVTDGLNARGSLHFRNSLTTENRKCDYIHFSNQLLLLCELKTYKKDKQQGLLHAEEQLRIMKNIHIQQLRRDLETNHIDPSILSQCKCVCFYTKAQMKRTRRQTEAEIKYDNNLNIYVVDMTNKSGISLDVIRERLHN